MNFKVIMAKDGSKLYLICEEYGLFYYPVGRFVGCVLQRQANCDCDERRHPVDYVEM